MGFAAGGVLTGSPATLTPLIDEVVASQLWLEIRSFAWQRLDKVAANILGQHPHRRAAAACEWPEHC